MRGNTGCYNKYIMPLCIVICRTVFILSEALDEQLKTLWFSPFQTDDIEADLDMVSVYVYMHFQNSVAEIIILILYFVFAKLSYFLFSAVLVVAAARMSHCATIVILTKFK